MTAPPMRILRGNDWGERLQRELAGSSCSGLDFMQQRTELLKSDAHSWVGLIHLSGRLCYLKFYRAKSVGQNLLFRFGFARGLRSFDAAEKLMMEGVQVPAPLACLRLDDGILLLTEGVMDAKDLKGLWQEPLAAPEQSQLMSSAGRALSGLHRAGYCHGDCKWSNFLWSQHGFYLVDLEGVKKTAASSKHQAKDLARFTVNAEDLGVSKQNFELFLDSYLKESHYTRGATIHAIMPWLHQLRARHTIKYGRRGQQILGDP